MFESAAQPGQLRKISRFEWTAIADRHHQGESFASIARAYNCTPPAIRYIVRRESQLRGGEAVEVPPSTRSRPSAASRSGRTAAAGPSRQMLPTTGLNVGLRDSTTGEVANFLVAFDSALEGTTAHALEALRGATDRLLRAVARVRIALEPVINPPTKDVQD
jgi:hypothetical protein